MTSPPTTKKKSIRELSSIANHLLMTKTLNSLGNFQNSSTPMSSIENTPSYFNSLNDTKVDATRSNNNNNNKPMDNIAALLQFYQTLANATNSSTVAEKSFENLQQTTTTKRSTTSEMTPMTYLCRFYQRNRLIELPTNGDFHHGISRETLKQLISKLIYSTDFIRSFVKEFQLHSSLKENLIIQIWNEQYQEYIDIESFKRIPCEGRLQVFIDKESIVGVESMSNSKSPSTPVSSQMITTTARSITPNPTQTTPDALRIQSNSIRSSHFKEDLDSSPQINMKTEQNYDESINTISPMRPMDNLNSTNVMYDLLAKPSEGIPIPRFPPHIAAFLNGNGDANQLNALVQALYQEIVKYELYPNADELRSIVTRLVERYPSCVNVIGSIELLVRKLYYKFCNERKKYPVELKRRQPNKRKRLIREDEVSMISQNQAATLFRRQENLSNDFHQSSLDRLMHLWTSTAANDYQITVEQTNSPSGSSSNSSSPVSQRFEDRTNELQKSHPLNLSATTNSNNFMCTE